MAVSELGCAYASLILHDDGIQITADKIRSLVQAANVNVESYWPSLYSKLAEKKNLGDLILNAFSAGAASPAAVTAITYAAPAAEAAVEKKKEEPKEEESDEEGGIFGLFDD